MEAFLHEDYENTDVIIYSSGLIYWVPPMTLHTTCELDYSYWPWDTQKCCMIIGSWTKSGWEIDVVNMNHKNVRHPFSPFTFTVCYIWKWLKYWNGRFWTTYWYCQTVIETLNFFSELKKFRYYSCFYTIFKNYT